MIKELFPHQKEAEGFILTGHKGRSCLFWEVGTGKTNAAVNAINQLPQGRLLIAAPKCVISGMWEIYDDLPINHDVTMVSYEYLSRNYRDYTKNNKFDYVIADECHKLKSHKSKVHKCIKSITKSVNGCKFVVGLTGTPYATSFVDVHGIFAALNIEEFKDVPSAKTFLLMNYNVQTIPVTSGYVVYKPISLKPGALDILVKRVGKHSSVLRTTDCVELPGLTVKEIKIPGMRTKEYVDGVKGIITYANEQKETVNKLACVQKLHQMSNGFVYDETHKAYVFKVNNKLKKISELIEMELESRDKLIIIYIYKQDEEMLSELLTKMGLSYTKEFGEFASKQILLMQEQKAIGINLQAFTSCMIFYTFNYSYLEYTQAIGRIYRTGQREHCSVYTLINEGTSEQKIWDAVVSRKDMDELFKDLIYNLEV